MLTSNLIKSLLDFPSTYVYYDTMMDYEDSQTFSDGDQFVIKMAKFGLEKENLKIRLKGKRLFIDYKCEEKDKKDRWACKDFNYQYVVPEGVEERHLKATYDKGIVSITIQKPVVVQAEEKIIPVQ